MKTPRFLVIALACALASACATTGNPPAEAAADLPPQPRAEPVATAAEDPVQVVDEAIVEPAMQDEAAAGAAEPAGQVAASAADATAADEAESDFAAIYGDGDAGATPGAAPSTAYDPWEKYNRRVHAFNSVVDRGIARPLAQAYTSVVPRPVRTGIGNFFDNLGEPVTIVNSLLQGNGRGAINALGRFLLNSTLGIGGLLDLADRVKMPNRDEDFGQTLATWGWKRSRYIEVPFLGPRTVRDLFGLAADTPLRPLHYLEDDKSRLFLQGVQAVDLRARLLAVESLGEGAVDEYALYRDIWLQRRNYQIHQVGRKSHPPTPGEDLPDYLREDVSAPAGDESAQDADGQP